ncbi:FtsX-like permease family protein [Haladaptatus caseinilyticus]|uniref:ABC transporter permease n=1 Tax=Haladaptatus caseinilyticus TaxID=2993314 RepID=UPI00224B4F13|nr:ABC transporter permease [Haladaptatus caseinilyticus]
MGYRRHLLTRWSRRDALAVLVVVVTVAFITGVTLVVLAAGSQTTSIAKEYDAGGRATYYETMQEARVDADDGALVLPVASVTKSNGVSTFVVGVSCDRAREFRKHTSYSMPCSPDSGVSSGVVASKTKQTVTGEATRRTLLINSRSDDESIIPPYWYVADESVVDRLGRTGAFVVDPTSGNEGNQPDDGTPLRSALPFFLAGIEQVITVLGVTAVGTSVLVGVTVYGVTRMHTRDRRRAIRVVRATGGVPGRILRLYGIRAGAITAVGTVLGYATGVVATNVVVNAAIYLGIPTSLSIHVTPRAATFLLPLYGVTIVVGAMAGVLAAWRITRHPPIPSGLRFSSSCWRSSVRDTLSGMRSLTLLDWRVLVPSVVPLAAFATVVILVASITGVVTPLVQTSGTTISDTNAPHPISSRVPANYATALETRGTEASPEILAFAVHDGEPMVVRGMQFESFARVSNASLVRGRQPRSPGEAVIGADLARTLDLAPNDTVTLGGSTTAGIDRVTIVGEYAAPGAMDDQLLVPLPTARHLARVEPGMVQLIRTPTAIASDENGDAVIGDVSVPTRIRKGATIPIRIQLENLGSNRVNKSVRVHVGDRTRSKTVSLGAGERREVAIRVPTTRLGPKRVTVGGYNRTVRVVPRDAIELHGVPERTPPNSTPLVRVSGIGGDPIRNATVSVGDETTTTGSNGTARVRFGSPGNATIRATSGEQMTTRTIQVSQTASRTLVGHLRVQPRKPTLLTRPTARVALTNPWNETLSRTVTIATESDRHTRTIRLKPGERKTIRTQLDHRSPGSVTVRAMVGGRTVAERTYQVVGDDRIASALANSGRKGETGISRAITTAFGDLNLLVGVFVCLAGLMTVGSTTATVAYTVHSRRRVVGVFRATGASPFRILSLILFDAVVVGTFATLLAFAVAIATVSVLAKAGLLVMYGVRITPLLNLPVVVGVVVGGIGVMCLSSVFVAGTLIGEDPDSLLSERPPQTRRSAESGGKSNE